MENLLPPWEKMNHSCSRQNSNGKLTSSESDDHSSEVCGEPSTPQVLVATPTTNTISAMTGTPLQSTASASGSSTNRMQTLSSYVVGSTATSSSSVAATAITSSYSSSATSPLSTRYPAKIHYKLQNRSSPTNLSSGCPTTNNSPSTSSVSSPVTSEQHSPLLSPSAHSSNNGNCLYDINEEIDQAMQSSGSALPNIRSSDTVTPTMETAEDEDIETDDVNALSSGKQTVSTLQTTHFSQSNEEDMAVTDAAAEIETVHTEIHNAPHFKKGSVIELGNKTLKRIEEITADDLMQFSGSNCLKFAKVDKIQMSNGVGVTQKPSIEITLISNLSSLTTTASIEQPFISKDDGWVSASPQITTQLYGLPCQPIKIGSQLLIGFTTSAQYGHVGATGSDSTTNGQHLNSGSTSTSTGYKLESSVTSGARSAFTPLPSSPGRHSVARKRTLDFDSNNFGTSKSPNLQTPETKVS